MRIYNGLHEICEPFHEPALVIGNFDGVHLGHQALFQKVVEVAGDGDKLALTFEPHPMVFLRPEKGLKRISTLEQKIEMIRRSGIEHLIILPFNKELADTPADVFVQHVLCDKIGVKHLIVGYDYAFGKGRQGDIPFLRQKGKEYGFSVHVVEPVMVHHMVVSSTKIRELVARGDVRMVYDLLGRYYQIRGEVRHGYRRGGSLLGYPTANLHLEEDYLSPASGVYAVQVICLSSCFWGVLNIGVNPTFNGQTVVAEAHLLDFDGELYGKQIKVNLVEKLRDERKFNSVDELRMQIGRDIESARLILSQEPGLGRGCVEGIMP